MMVINDGVIQTIYPHSGHYRPSEHELVVLLRFLVAQGVELANIQVDVQRIQKVFRDTVNGALIRKLDNAHFWNAFRVLFFLEAKHLAWKIDELVETVVKKRQLALNGSPMDQVMAEPWDVTTGDFVLESPPTLAGKTTRPVILTRPTYDPIFEDSLELLTTCEMQH